MRARRLDNVTGFGIDKVAAAAGDDPEILRMENLDTDVPPPPGVVEVTRDAIGPREYNSWLPFSGAAACASTPIRRLQSRPRMAAAWWIPCSPLQTPVMKSSLPIPLMQG